MENKNFNTYDIPKGGYAAFDARSLRQLIINRLNEQGVFTDQNYIGSNLASIIDIVAYAYNTLIFYLNRTSTESLFSEAQLYENINRIVKLIDYSPVGAQTATLAFSCSADNLTQGLYTLPRYSYLLAGTTSIPYSFNEDITFSKTQNTTLEYIPEISEQKLLYQGIYQEYPTYTAAGEDYETVILNPGNDNIIDHFNIDVYVKPALTNKWEMFSKTPNLYLENSASKKYEIRLNQNRRYEIKFGDNVNGYRLQTGDQVGIYYLRSLGTDGVVAAGAFSFGPEFTKPQIFNTLRYNEIIADVLEDQYQLVTENQSRNVKFTNSQGSTDFAIAETAEQIRENAPITYRSQYRLVTAKDYETFIRSNFAGFVSDAKVFNNSEYIFNYMQYFNSIGISDSERTTRALYNQVSFADACNFNNVYLVLVPRSPANLTYLLPVQKELINSALQDNKVLTSETTFIDPVYMAFSVGVTETVTDYDPIEEELYGTLVVVKQKSSNRSDTAIKQDVVNIFKEYFSQDQMRMGQVIQTQFLTQSILEIEGITDCYTTRIDNTNNRSRGVSFIVWNPVYPVNDYSTTTSDVPLLPFQYGYYYNFNQLFNRIVVTTSNPFKS